MRRIKFQSGKHEAVHGRSFQIPKISEIIRKDIVNVKHVPGKLLNLYYIQIVDFIVEKCKSFISDSNKYCLNLFLTILINKYNVSW